MKRFEPKSRPPLRTAAWSSSWYIGGGELGNDALASGWTAGCGEIGRWGAQSRCPRSTSTQREPPRPDIAAARPPRQPTLPAAARDPCGHAADVSADWVNSTLNDRLHKRHRIEMSLTAFAALTSTGRRESVSQFPPSRRRCCRYRQRPTSPVHRSRLPGSWSLVSLARRARQR